MLDLCNITWTIWTSLLGTHFVTYFYLNISILVNMNNEKNMNPWIWIGIGISMNHEFRIGQISMNPWISFLKNTWTHEYENWHCHKLMNMNIKFSWTNEYEYGHVTLWTFKSSYISWNCMNYAMNHMNGNACFFFFVGFALSALATGENRRGETGWGEGGGGEREDWPPCSTLPIGLSSPLASPAPHRSKLWKNLK